MPIYRGDGGSGDSSTDAYASQVAQDAQTATTKANEAAASATAAASSASAAASSETNADSSKTAAASSASAAATSATSASSSASTATTQASNAANSASSAASNAGIAATRAAEAATSASNASTSETNAASSASAASTSATNAASSATAAATSATNAASSATAAASSATAAAASATAAEAARDAIEAFYLGAQSSNPTVDLNGDAVTAGDWYFNTTDNTTRIYDGSSWNTVSPDLVGDTSPQLGGTLDANNYNIDMGVNVITDPKVGQWETAYGWGDHSTAGYTTADSTTTFTNKSGNISQWTNDSGYITGYTEVDTLDSVTGRGSSTTNSVTVGGLHVNATTAVEMPAGTDAERPTPVAGMLRFNTTSTSFEGYDGSAWGAIGGGGGATEGVFYENDQTLSTSVTIAGTKNAMATGPVAIASGVSFTVSDGARVVIL